MGRIAKHTSEETKQSIQDAFIELYLTKRLEQITIGELSKKARINRGTFYRYYQDIYDLQEQIEEKYIEILADLIPILIHGILHNDLLSTMKPLESFYEHNKDVLLLFFLKHPSSKFLSSIKNNAKQYVLNELNLEEEKLTWKQQCLIEYICNAQLGLVTWWLEHGSLDGLPILAQTMVEANTQGPLHALLMS